MKGRNPQQQTELHIEAYPEKETRKSSPIVESHEPFILEGFGKAVHHAIVLPSIVSCTQS